LAVSPVESFLVGKPDSLGFTGETATFKPSTTSGTLPFRPKAVIESRVTTATARLVLARDLGYDAVMKTPIALASAATLAICLSGFAADPTAAGKPMKMDEPMRIKMMKPGMKKGDVKEAADKKQREMAPMLEKEAEGRRKK
jgi:hypothetical protein